MNRRITFRLSLLAALVLASTTALSMLSGAARAQTAKDLVGTWKIVSSVSTAADGTKTANFGPHGIGNIIYESNGRFTAVQINPDIPKFASNNRAQGTPDENKAAVSGSLAEIGTYSVADKVITLKIEGCSYPNWTGTNQKRTIASLTADDMTLAFGGSFGGESETIWKRIK